MLRLKAFSLLVLGLSLYASDEVSEQVRFDINPQWYSKENIKIYGQIGVRKDFSENAWIRYVLKPSVAYSLSEGWQLKGGVGFLYTDNQNVNTIEIQDRLEIRPFQGINYIYELTDAWRMSCYGSIEERFDFDTQTRESVNSLRLRFKISTKYQFNAYQADKYYRAMLSWEGFSTIEGTAGQINEKSRLTLGLERSFNHNQKARIELSYEHNDYGYLSNGKSTQYSNVIFRLRYYPSWGHVLLNRLKREE